jgi:hypothetical protein
MPEAVGASVEAVAAMRAPPLLIRAFDGAAVLGEVDVAPGDEPTAGRAGGLQVTASWTQTGPPLAWDVHLDVENVTREPLRAGLVVAVRLPPALNPGWLVPGLFYGENRPAASAARYPRWALIGAHDPFAALEWSFRSDRTATPVVFASSEGATVALATTELSAVGPTGVGFGGGGDGSSPVEIRLSFPYREEPLVYDGSPEPAPPDLPTHRWEPGRTVPLTLRLYVVDAGPFQWAPILRDLHARLTPEAPLAPWVAVDQAAELAAEGLLRWHFHPDEAAIYETAAFERPGDGSAIEPDDRRAMHVAWLSGAPVAAALAAHGRRTGRADATESGRAVLDAIAGHLAPCGTYWGQWTAAAGWGKGWTPGPDALHARTLGEAALFMSRAAAGEPDSTVGAPWREAVASNLAFVLDRQRADGAIPSAWNGRRGEVLSWEGCAGLAWIPALVEAAPSLVRPEVLDAAARAGEFYSTFVDREFLFGAPEDVDLGPTSEDGYVAVMAYVALAAATRPGGDRDRWIDIARRAADWMLTFRYTYDVAFSPDSVLGRHRYRSRGADMASPANQHLHTYGLICVPELVRLSYLTGDSHYAERAHESLANARQFIARRDGDFGARRGMAPERYYQTHYGGPKGGIGPLSHAWCLGLLLWASEAAADLPELGDGR